MSMFCAMASTLSGTRKKEESCPTSVPGRSLSLRKFSRTPLLMRQCLPIFRHGSFPSLRLIDNILFYLTLSYFTLSCRGKTRLPSAAQNVAERKGSHDHQSHNRNYRGA